MGDPPFATRFTRFSTAANSTRWSHPRSLEIYAATRVVRDSPDVLVCRLLAGKATFVHWRLVNQVRAALLRTPIARGIGRVV